jgi:ABC-type Fe3+/spermidine/putrescine transport system ATPase subunit
LDAVRFAFGPTAVLAGVSLGVAPGGFFSLLGPSGGGKTTLLRLVGGYLTPSAGRIRIHGRDVTGRPPEARNVGMVFQNYALFPHLSARENVAFGLEMHKVPRAARARRAEAMLDRVGLSAAERDRRPSRLSGGQQQRVALARALVIEPALLLLDEPLANLDRQLREQLRGELKELQRRTGVTTVLVTHDRDEALQLADRVGVLAAGMRPGNWSCCGPSRVPWRPAARDRTTGPGGWSRGPFSAPIRSSRWRSPPA